MRRWTERDVARVEKGSERKNPSGEKSDEGSSFHKVKN